MLNAFCIHIDMTIHKDILISHILVNVVYYIDMNSHKDTLMSHRFVNVYYIG